MAAAEPLSILEAAAAIKGGKLTAVDLTRQYLDRIARLDGDLSTFVTVTAGRALSAAARADEEIAAGKWRGPLHGIPIALKDVIDVADVRTTACSKLLLENVPEHNSNAWARLEQAGAVLLGKLTTHEFAIGGPSFDLPFPPARNPWDRTRFTGGSSSGSGAAVAAGLVPGALGTDSGGSIRTPASYCGIVGMKPTYGLVGRSGVVPLSASLDHVGPMTRTVADNAMMLNVIAGYDPADVTSANRPPADVTAQLDEGVRGLRIGYAEEFDDAAGVSDEVRAAVQEVLRTLERLGARVETAALPSLEDMTDCTRLILMAESFAVHQRTMQGRAGDYGDVVRGRLMLGGLVSAADYIAAVRLRRELAVRMTEATALFDVIITAGTAHPAPKLEAAPKFALMVKPPLVFPFSLTGAPALAMPCGVSETGLPLSVQIAGKPFQEALVYRVAQAYEDATDWHKRAPHE